MSLLQQRMLHSEVNNISLRLLQVIIYVVLCLFAFTVYATNVTLGSPARVSVCPCACPTPTLRSLCIEHPLCILSLKQIQVHSCSMSFTGKFLKQDCGFQRWLSISVLLRKCTVKKAEAFQYSLV